MLTLACCVLSILFLCGINVGTALAICSIVLFGLVILRGILLRIKNAQTESLDENN